MPTSDRIVFAGDSITDAHRLADPDGLGEGYVQHLARSPQLAPFEVVNRGISGNRSDDLRARWATDVLGENPAVVSVLIGINDTWRRYKTNEPTTLDKFVSNYRILLDSLRDGGIPTVVMEPFVIPVTADQRGWAEDLDPKRNAVAALADEYGAVFVPLHGPLNALAAEVGAARIAADGVHPTDEGHRAIAGLWTTTTTERI